MLAKVVKRATTDITSVSLTFFKTFHTEQHYTMTSFLFCLALGIFTPNISDAFSGSPVFFRRNASRSSNAHMKSSHIVADTIIRATRTIPSRITGSLKDTTTSLQSSLISEAVNGYSSFMVQYPLATQSLTGGVLSGVGDSLAQYNEDGSSSSEGVEVETEKKSFDPDFHRTVRFMLKGLGGGMIWSEWYGVADGWSALLYQNVMGSFDFAGLGNIQAVFRTTISIMLEQFVACPIIYAFWDIPVPTVLSGVPAKEIPGQVKGKIGGLLVENAKVWTFVNMIIYNVPLEWRTLAVSTADVFWASVVSSVANSRDDDEEDDAAVNIKNTPTSGLEGN